MKTRTITGVILVAILVPIFILGGLALNILLMALTLAATYELFKMYNTRSNLPISIMIFELVLGGLLYFTIQGYYLGDSSLEYVFLLLILIVIIGAMLLVFVSNFNANNYGEMFVAILYPSLGFGAILALRSLGLYNIGFLFMITIMTDVFAYLVGVKFGKHRLAINISPKKSIEGSIGGTFFAIVLTMLYVYIFSITSIGDIELNIIISISLIMFISIVGQIGDLVASKLKRNYGIKDYSNIFPGHGGVMDRFDSAIFAAMVLMLISKVVGIV